MMSVMLYNDAEKPSTVHRKYKRTASGYWDEFYRCNRTAFFKDRHYLEREFPLLVQQALTILEVRSCIKAQLLLNLHCTSMDLKSDACIGQASPGRSDSVAAVQEPCKHAQTCAPMW